MIPNTSQSYADPRSIGQNHCVEVLAEQVDLAEKAFHDALARRNEAQIAYLREPSVVTREAFEGAKTAEAVALEILDTEVRRLARTRATTVTEGIDSPHPLQIINQ